MSDQPRYENPAGQVVVVYSPTGGAGCTTVTTNLAVGLANTGARVLLLDADLSYGDVGILLKLIPPATLAALFGNGGEPHPDLIDKALMPHEAGMHVLWASSGPEEVPVFQQNPPLLTGIVDILALRYDFILIDTTSHLDALSLSLFDSASGIVLLTLPTLASIKNVRLTLELFEKLEYPPEKTLLVLNRAPADDDHPAETIEIEKIERYLNRPFDLMIPGVNESTLLWGMNRGIPALISAPREAVPFVDALLSLSDMLAVDLEHPAVEISDQEAAVPPTDKETEAEIEEVVEAFPPPAPTPQPIAEPVEPPLDKPAPAPAMESITILIVDDTEADRFELLKLLTPDTGFEVVGIANDGQRALEQVQTLQPDIVIIDNYIPGTNSYDIVRRLSKEYRESKVIMVSDAAEPGDMRKAMLAGARDFVTRAGGMSAEELYTTIRNVHSPGSVVPPQRSSRFVWTPAGPTSSTDDADGNERES